MRLYVIFAIILAFFCSAIAPSTKAQSSAPPSANSSRAILPQGVPDLSGVWYPITDKDGGFWASWVAGDKFGLKGIEVPMTPAGKAKYDANIPGEGYRYATTGVNDPATFLCLPAGVPRVYMEPNLIEFVQQP